MHKCRMFLLRFLLVCILISLRRATHARLTSPLQEKSNWINNIRLCSTSCEVITIMNSLSEELLRVHSPNSFVPITLIYIQTDYGSVWFEIRQWKKKKTKSVFLFVQLQKDNENGSTFHFPPANIQIGQIWFLLFNFCFHWKIERTNNEVRFSIFVSQGEKEDRTGNEIRFSICPFAGEKQKRKYFGHICTICVLYLLHTRAI